MDTAHGETVGLDQQVWGRLPSDILDMVLARLPCANLFRLRVVCKRWNSLPSTPHFLKLCQQVPLAKEPFYLINISWEPKKLELYDPASDICRIMDLYFVSDLIRHAKEEWNVRQVHPWLCAADGGLLVIEICARDKNRLYRMYIVCNPLSSSFKMLPDLPPTATSPIPEAKKLVVDKSTKSYKFILAGGDGHITWLYDSILSCWIEIPTWQQIEFTRSVIPPSELTHVMCGYDHNVLLYGRETMLALLVPSGVWGGGVRLQKPNYIAGYGFNLVVHKGHLFLVGVIWNDNTGEALSFCVWKQTVSGLGWQEVARIPAPKDLNVTGWKAFGHCDRIFIRQLDSTAQGIYWCALETDVWECIEWQIEDDDWYVGNLSLGTKV